MTVITIRRRRLRDATAVRSDRVSGSLSRAVGAAFIERSPPLFPLAFFGAFGSILPEPGFQPGIVAVPLRADVSEKADGLFGD
ncbi:hypothetical protein, partial [Actinomadura harenae]|uniref:hypothetical protein n=1 Tax=Actinomadura harenae TaxID=2483351 RepID=UPI001F3B9D4C